MATPERILPDGCIELIFNLADPFKRHHFDGTLEVQPSSIITGQMQHYAMIEPAGRVKLFGVRFHPGGAYPFLQFPLSELTNKIVGIEDLWPHVGRELAERIQSGRSLRERIQTMEVAFRDRLNHNWTGDALVDTVVKMIVFRNGLISMDRLCKNLGIGERQLERKFKTEVGLSPKFLCRILRFQKVFKAVELRQKVNWSFVASECGYYDQAHFIHDFKAFSGQNPSAYFDHEYQMSEYFTRKNRMSDFYNTSE